MQILRLTASKLLLPSVLAFALLSYNPKIAAAFSKGAALPQIKTTPQINHAFIHKIAVLGKDDRLPLPEQYIDLASGIGILGQPGKHGWSCTAFCVAPDIVATNAHCIVKNPSVGRRLNLAKTIFILPKFNSPKRAEKYRYLASRIAYVQEKTPALSVFSGRFHNTQSVKSQNEDWAFTKLSKSICKGRTLSFEKKALSEIFNAAAEKKVFMIGFHGDQQMQDRLYSDNCHVRLPNNKKYFLSAQRQHMQQTAQLLPHTCDAYKGSSGSPIFLSTPKGPKVIGINLGSLRYERYEIKKNRYTGQIISKKKLKDGRETNMAVRPRAFLEGLNRFKEETLLYSNAQIKTVQENLKALNFYRGRIDGVFGARSQRALIAYEKENGLAPLGMPTQEILMRLQKQNIDKEEEKQAQLKQ